MKKNRKRNSMPSKSSIKKYWGKFLFDTGKIGDLECLSDDFCFACRIKTKTERCHIIPFFLSNDNTVQNFHLLCPYCHKQSEYLETKPTYYQWFYSITNEKNTNEKNLFNYTKSTSERTKRILKIKKESGEHCGGVGLGYSIIDKVLVKNQDYKIVELVLSLRKEGLAMNKIASYLNDKGIATARGGAWHSSTIKAILDREKCKNIES